MYPESKFHMQNIGKSIIIHYSEMHNTLGIITSIKFDSGYISVYKGNEHHYRFYKSTNNDIYSLRSKL